MQGSYIIDEAPNDVREGTMLMILFTRDGTREGRGESNIGKEKNVGWHAMTLDILAEIQLLPT